MVEQVEIWEAHRAGQEAARLALVERYSYLVKGTLLRLRRAPERFHDDLLGAGRLALVLAVDRYDPARGVKFTTYAIRMIYGAMLQWLRDEDWTPRSERDREKRGEPALILEQISLEAIVYGAGEKDDLKLLDRLADWEDTPDVIVPRRLEHGVLAALVRFLPKRPRQVVVGYYWQEKTYREIGRQLGVSESRVEQIHTRTLMLLKTWLVNRNNGYDRQATL